MKTTLKDLKLPAMMTVLGLSTLMTQAQPDLGAAKGANPPNRTPGQLVANMTPEQRRTLMQGRIEEQLQNRRTEMLRQSLNQSGFDDKTVQDAIIDFSNQQIKAALSIRDKTDRVSESLADKATADTQISVLLNDLRTAQADEKERRAAAEKALDAKINYTKKPRLEALLTTLNLIGVDGGLMNIVSSIGGGRGAGLGAGGLAGRGVAGGAFGGGRRGFGAYQNGAGAGQNAQGNAQGNDVFGLRRERGLRRNNNEDANKPKTDAKVGA